MTGYELSRAWFDFCYENTSKITPTHTALFFFIVEHNNRLGQKKEFGLPRQMAMDAIGIKNNRTFTKVFEDLINWDFITILQRSKNQYSANIIALSKNTPATTKALDNAMLMHSQKQSTSNLTGIAPIDKHNNIIKEEPNTIKGKKELDEEIYYPVTKLKEFYVENETLVKAITENKDNKLKDKAQLEIRLEEFNVYCLETGKNSRRWNDYTTHFRNWNKKQKEIKSKNERRPTDNLVF